jgi:hypothetical protein
MADVDVEALRTEAARLFAEHQALRAANIAKAPARDAEMSAAMDLQQDAFKAEDRAWDAVDAAYDALRTNPGDPALRAAVDAAQATAELAVAEAVAASQKASDVAHRQCDEVGAETQAVIDLGERFRAAQGALIQAEWEHRRKEEIVTYDEYHRRLPGGGFTCERWGCTHVNGRAELVERDLAQELADAGLEPPIADSDRSSGPTGLNLPDDDEDE